MSASISNSSTKQRAWVFRISNPRPLQNEDDDLETWEDVEQIKYCCYQLERSESGLIHYQGYVVFKNPQRMSFCKSLHARAHWEVRRGTHDQARDYAQKEETRVKGPWRFGDETGLGKKGFRSDLVGMKRMLDEGESMKKVADAHFPCYIRNHRGIEKYSMLAQTKLRSWETHTSVYWGPPGSGKTKRALFEAGESSYWLSKPGKGQQVFFDGYDGHEVLVIDEFYGWIPRGLMQSICDRYPLNVHTKGGMVPFLAKKVIITSNTDPREWWSNIGLGPMTRRLTDPLGEIVHMNGPVWQSPLEIEAEAVAKLAEMANKENEKENERWEQEEAWANEVENRLSQPDEEENLADFPDATCDEAEEENGIDVYSPMPKRRRYDSDLDDNLLEEWLEFERQKSEKRSSVPGYRVESGLEFNKN